MPEEKDEWRQLYQCLPLSVYDRFMVGLGRVALANGIAPGALLDDDKFAKNVGARVQSFELLAILLERSDAEALRV